MSAQAPSVVLIHGMWMTPRSWDNWVDHYRDRGYNAIAPGWPGVKDPEETRRDPAGLKGLGLTQIVDHYDQIIRGLPAADHHRALVRRAHRAAAARPRPRRRRCRNRDCAAEGDRPPAAVDAAGGLPGPEEPVRPQRALPALQEAVSLALHEHAQPGGVGSRLRRALHPGDEPCLLRRARFRGRGRFRQGEARAPPADRRERGSHQPGLTESEHPEAAEQGALGDRAEGVRRADALHGRDGRLGGGCRPRA